MKQKFTVTVADMQISVITEAPSEEVEKVVGVLDRRIRSLMLKSQNCSKTEATLLCALDFCADKIQTKEALEIVLSDLEDQKEKNAILEEKLALLEKNLEKTESECARLRAENKRLLFNGEVYNHGESQAPKTDAEQPAPSDEDKKAAARSRTGSMFDMLTFSDI